MPNQSYLAQIADLQMQFLVLMLALVLLAYAFTLVLWFQADRFRQARDEHEAVLQRHANDTAELRRQWEQARKDRLLLVRYLCMRTEQFGRPEAVDDVLMRVLGPAALGRKPVEGYGEACDDRR